MTTANHPTPTRRVIVVDDDSVTRLLIIHHLKRNGYEVIAAPGVEAAKTAIRTATVAALDAVVTDYLMPDGTGLELINWLKKEDESISAIVVTSMGERDLVKASLRGGACDFLDKPVQIEALLNSVRDAVNSTERARHLKETESSVQEVGRFQQFMLGGHGGSGSLPVEICWHPKHLVGGDLVNVIPLGPQRFLLLVADVSGHDLKAGFISAYFQGVVRGMVEKGAPIAEVFTCFNRFLVSEWTRIQHNGADSVAASISACAFVVDLSAKKLTVFNSGFPVPIVATPDGQTRACGNEPGFPLGWFPDSQVSVVERDLPEACDVYIWTDGLEELAGSLGANPLAVASELMAARRQDRNAACLSRANDDVLVVRLNLHGETNVVAETITPVVYQELTAGDDRQIDDFQATWDRSLRLAVAGMPDDKLSDILLCSREAVINAIRYGCSKPGGTEERSTYQVSWDRQAAILRVVVTDHGPGHDFQWETHVKEAADNLIDSHRGLALIHQLPTSTRTECRGARVTMEFALRQP